MKSKKVMSTVTALALVAAITLTGCSKPAEKTDAPAESTPATEEAIPDDTIPEEPAAEIPQGELPTITFTHGYYHDESEWAVAAEMRKIYQEFADAHKAEFNFVIVADESGAEGIYNTALNDLAAGGFYDIADFGGWDITEAAASADMIMDLKPYLDSDADMKAGAGVCYDQNLTADGKIYSVREQIEGVGFWYNKALFEQAGADTPDKWLTWADFDTAVNKLSAAKIAPFGLNPGWPASILTAAYFQRSDESRTFYGEGKAVESFDKDAFKRTMDFMQNNVLGKIDSANFGTGGDDDEAYRADFFAGKTAMLFNGVWDAGGTVGCEAGAENIKPAVFPTDESGKKAALLSGGCGFVVSNKLDEAQTKASIEFIKYMTSKEIAERIVAKGIGLAPSTAIDYAALEGTVDAPEAKLLIEACNLCSNADYKALGLGNNFGDYEGQIVSKYPGLKDGSMNADAVVKALNDFKAASE